MQQLDRVALIVRPKRRFVDWANALPGDSPHITLEEIRAVPTIYLAEHDDEQEPEVGAIVERCGVEIFEDLLFGWEQDESAWPPNRTTHVFRDWFDVELSDLVQDVDDDAPLVSDEPSFTALDAMGQCGWCLRELNEGEEPIPVTMSVTTDDAVHVPPDQTVPWFVPNAQGVALATAPEDGRSPSEGRTTLTFWVCSAECAAGLRTGFDRQIMQTGPTASGAVPSPPPEFRGPLRDV